MYYAHFHFMRTRCFGKRTTGGSESENSVMKRSHIGPRSNQTLDQAQSAIARVNDLRTQRKNTSAAASVDQQAARVSDRASSLPELTDYANGELFQQFYDRLNYHVVPDSNSANRLNVALKVLGHFGQCLPVALFYVKRKDYTGCHCRWDDPLFLKFVIPHFLRTRIILVVESAGKRVLACSCCYFEQHGRPCRHMYSVLTRAPAVHDVDVRWLKIYAAQDGVMTNLHDFSERLRKSSSCRA